MQQYCPRASQGSSPAPQFKSINFSTLSFLYYPALASASVYDYWKNHSFDYMFLWWQHDVSASFFFFFLKKALLFPFGPRLERGLQSVEKLPSWFREGLQAALMLRELLKGYWVPETPSHAWGWAFQKDICPTQPGDQPACRGESGGHPSSWEFHLIWKWFSRKSQMRGSTQAEPSLCRPKRAWFRFFSLRRVASIAS